MSLRPSFSYQINITKRRGRETTLRRRPATFFLLKTKYYKEKRKRKHNESITMRKGLIDCSLETSF